MPKTIEELIQKAQNELANHGNIESTANSALAIAQMMHAYMTAPIATAELVAEPCQCKAEADELAAAAPELLELVREIARGGEILLWICPWCHKDTSHYQKHAPDCPAAAILKRFEDR